MISLTKIIDPLSGYISKVKSDSNERQKNNQNNSIYIKGPSKLLSADDANKAAYINRLNSEIDEIISGLQNLRDGKEIINRTEVAYQDALRNLEEMLSIVNDIQQHEKSLFDLSSDSSDLQSSLSKYNDEFEKIISNTKFRDQSLLDGSFINKSFPLWHNEKKPASISIDSLDNSMSSSRILSSFSLSGDIAANINSSNISSNKNITINGPEGTEVFIQSDGESARSIASRINNMTKEQIQTGVVASARTSLKLGNLSDSGTISFKINTDKTLPNGIGTGSIVISDKDNLTPLKEAVNAISKVTNVFAYSDNNSNVILRNHDGANIELSSFSHSVGGGKITASIERRDGISDFSMNSEDVSYGATSGYAGGSLRFDVTGNLTFDKITLSQDQNISNNVGQVSLNGNKVYIGNGSSAAEIGSVDNTLNGLNGNALQINFSNNNRTFDNGNFSSLSSWTLINQQIKLGIDQIGGLNSPSDSSYPADNGSPAVFDRETINSGNFTSNISSGNLRMTSSSLSSPTAHAVVRGPAVVSNDSVTIAQGERVSFRWKAEGGSDAYDVNAYLVNVDNNNFISMLNRTASSSSETTNFETISARVPTAGNYKFVFVNGSYDFGGDANHGSQIYLDDISVSAVSDDILDQISDNITFEKLNFSASNTSYTPQISVISVTGGGNSNTNNINVSPSLTGFTMITGQNHKIYATGEVSLLSKDSFTITQQDASDNGTTFFENENSSSSSLTIGELSGTTSLINQNAVERITLAIEKLTILKDKNLPVLQSQFDVRNVDTSNYLKSIKFDLSSNETKENVLSLSERTAKMIINDEVQNLLSKIGNSSANDVYELLRFT